MRLPMSLAMILVAVGFASTAFATCIHPAARTPLAQLDAELTTAASEHNVLAATTTKTRIIKSTTTVRYRGSSSPVVQLNGKAAKIAGGVIGGVLVLICVMVGVLKVRSKLRSRSAPDTDDETPQPELTTAAPMSYVDPQEKYAEPPMLQEQQPIVKLL